MTGEEKEGKSIGLKKKDDLGMMTHADDTRSLGVAKAGGFLVWGQLILHSEALSKKDINENLVETTFLLAFPCQ